MISPIELESIAIEAYNEFYKSNEDLFKKDPVLYWHYASKFKEKKLTEYKIKHGGYESENSRNVSNSSIRKDRRD